MRNKIVLSFTGLIAIFILMALSIFVQASTVTVGPDNGNVDTHELDGGDEITWD